MAVLTSIPSTPETRTPQSLPTPPFPASELKRDPKDTPPKFVDDTEADGPTELGRRSESFADLVDLDFAFESAPSPVTTADAADVSPKEGRTGEVRDTLALTRRSQWEPLEPDRPGETKQSDSPSSGSMFDTVVEAGSEVDAQSKADEPHHRPSTPVPASGAQTATTSPTTSGSPLRVTAPPFTSREMHITRSRTPRAFYSDPSEPSEAGSPQLPLTPLTPAGHAHDRLGAGAGDKGAKDAGNDATSGDWAMQKGYGGYGKVPSPPITTAPMNVQTPHSPIVRRPIRITSPPAGDVRTSGSSKISPRTVPLPASELSYSPSNARTDASSPTRPESPLSKLTRSFSGFSLKVDGDSLGERETINGDRHDDSEGGIVGHSTARTESEEELEGTVIVDTQRDGKLDHIADRMLRSPAPSPPAITRKGDDLAQALIEVAEFDQGWATYRDAFGTMSALVEETNARLNHNLSGHVCATTTMDCDVLGQLRRARQDLAHLELRLSAAEAAKVEAEGQNEALLRKVGTLTASTASAGREVHEVKLREGVWRSKLETVRATCDRLTADQQAWLERERELAKSFVALEDDHRDAVEALKRLMGKSGEQAPTAGVESFAVALLEMSPFLIDAEQIKAGQAGGVQLAMELDLALRKLCEGADVATRIIVLFLDFPDVRRALQKEGTIEKEAQLHVFLDGFRSVSTLFTVIDSCTPGEVLQDHLKLYSKLGAHRILVGSRSRSISGLKKTIASIESGIVRAVQTRSDIADDSWEWIGPHKFVRIAGITPGESAQSMTANSPDGPQRRLSIATQSGVSVEYQTPVPTGRAGSLDPAQTPRKPVRETYTRPSSLAPSSPVLSISTPAPYRPGESLYPPSSPANSTRETPPWMTNSSATVTYAGKKRPSWQSTLEPEEEQSEVVEYWRKPGGTLLGAHLERKQIAETTPPATPRARTMSRGESSVGGYEEPSSPTPKKVLRDQRDSKRAPASGRSASKEVKLAIQYDPDEGSLVGSPPDSDEDNPSAELPHSAVKHVQRPTTFAPVEQSSSGSSYGGSGADAGIDAHGMRGWGGESGDKVDDGAGGGGGGGYGRGHGNGHGRDAPARGLSIRGRGSGGGGYGTASRGPAATNSNTTPLGGGRRTLSERITHSSGSGGASGSVGPGGFRIHQGQGGR